MFFVYFVDMCHLLPILVFDFDFVVCGKESKYLQWLDSYFSLINYLNVSFCGKLISE